MNITIGDTPEQLGSCLTADAVMIDGSVITKQQIAELMAQNAELVAQVEAIADIRAEAIDDASNEVSDLIRSRFGKDCSNWVENCLTDYANKIRQGGEI